MPVTLIAEAVFAGNKKFSSFSSSFGSVWLLVLVLLCFLVLDGLIKNLLDSTRIPLIMEPHYIRVLQGRMLTIKRTPNPSIDFSAEGQKVTAKKGSY